MSQNHQQFFSCHTLVTPLKHNKKHQKEMLRSAIRPRLFSAIPKVDPLLRTPATEITTLSNGLRVASEPGHGEIATVGVWIDGK